MADSLANICPDSALVLLEQLKESIGNEPEETQMYYHLLTIKAKDKAYITHTSDSLITQVLRYYRGKKNKKHLPMAYYYAGRVYSDLGDAPKALEYFLRAIDISKESTEYELLSETYSQTGKLYLYHDIYNDAYKAFHKAWKYDVLRKDSTAIIRELQNLGRTFSFLEQPDSAIHYYKEAAQLARHIENPELGNMINCELASYYANLEMYQEAYKTTQSIFNQKELLTTPNFCSVMALHYYFSNQPDSANYYYSQLLASNEYSYKETAYQGLTNIARQKGEYEIAWQYFDEFILYQDSLQKIITQEGIRKINSLYTHQLEQKEIDRQQQNLRTQKNWNILMTLSLLITIALFIAFREFYKREEQAKRTQQEKSKNALEKQYKSSLAQIRQNEKEIQSLETSLQEAIASKDELRQALLQAQKEYIQKNNEQIEAKQKMEEQYKISLASTDIYKKFQQASKKEELKEEDKIKDADWQELACAVDKAHDQFTQRLNELHPIKDIELRVCLLLKIGLSPQQIAVITIRSKQAITSVRKRLYQKFFKEDGTPNQWDSFIQEF